MTHSPLGLLHLASAFAALALGAVVLLRPKGGRTHRRLGYSYALAMVTVNGTALLIYRLTGRFNFLHVFALASQLTLVAGLVCAIRRRPAGDWLRAHYRFMGWSYIGLVGALVAESSTRALLPWLRQHGYTGSAWFGVIVGVATVFVTAVGGHLLNTRGPAAAMSRQTGPDPSAR